MKDTKSKETQQSQNWTNKGKFTPRQITVNERTQRKSEKKPQDLTAQQQQGKPKYSGKKKMG